MDPRTWVVEMENMLMYTNPSEEMVRWRQHSIYLVPECMDFTNRSAYVPEFVSLGPLHNGEPKLLPMEEHKRRAMLHMVRRSGQPLQLFVRAIEEVQHELVGAYNHLDGKWCGENIASFVNVMVTDGCFLLELMRTAGFIEEDGAEGDYAANDPIFGDNRFQYVRLLMRNDMIAMENQFPLVVLQRLLAVQHGKPPSNEAINKMVLRLLDCDTVVDDMNNIGLHLLDIFHRSNCGTCPAWRGPDHYEPRTPCAVELSEAGIKFKKSNTNNIHGINFEKGVLSMPVFKIRDSTEFILLNLMAFEWLHPGVKPHMTSYITFLDKIIESERDVALLRSKGIIINMMGSDKTVVKMFNTLTKFGISNKGNKLGHVQWMVNDYCGKRLNRWRASFENTYLSNPWVFLSLVAGFILLVATLLQTIYTIMPYYNGGK